MSDKYYNILGKVKQYKLLIMDWEREMEPFFQQYESFN